MKMAIRMIRSSVSKAAEFDIRLLSPIEHADRCVGTLSASIYHLALMYSLFLFLLFPQSAILNRLFFFLLLYSCLLLSPHFLITFLSIHFFLSLPVFFPLLVIFLPCLVLSCLALPCLALASLFHCVRHYRCFIPALFVAAEGDEFVPPHHR